MSEAIEKIESAILAHLKWLKNIKTAVLVSATMSKKNSDPTTFTKLVTKIESDYQCPFGKWLYETSESNAEKSIYYNQTVTLHAQFHLQAANILSLAFAGEKAQARTLVSNNSDFIQCSENLIEILEKWKSSL